MTDEFQDLPFFAKTAPTSFSWPVKVPVPADGRYLLAEFTGLFKYIPSDQIDAWLAPEIGRAHV